MSIALLVAIEPSLEIRRNIKKLRNWILEEMRKSISGLHEPHVTLFVNSFENFSGVEKIVNDIAQNYKPFTVNTEGIEVFENNPLAHGNPTFVYRVKDSRGIKMLQRTVVDRLNPLRTGDQANWCLKQNTHPSKKMLDNIAVYGYPFGPEDWKFHATIWDVPQDMRDKFFQEAKKYSRKSSWKVKGLGIYVHLGSDGFRLFKKYRLGG